MKSVRWRDVAELVGIAAVLASLLFVGLEMRQQRAIALSESDVSLLESTVQIRVSVNEHPEVWLRGTKGEQLSPTDSVIFRNLVINRNDKAWLDYRRAVRLGKPEIAQTVIHDFAGFLHRHPGARNVWLEREDRLLRYRDLLQPSAETYSFWRDTIVSDLRTLDERGE